MKNNKYVIPIYLALILILAGCMSAKAPLEALYYEQSPERRQNLIIFVRALGGTMNCFIEGHKCFSQEGFIDSVNQRNLPFDMVAPNTHFGYYNARNLETRLKEDIIDPARKQGYQKIWLVGTSMGALGSLLYHKRYPDDIDGILILGPFLGDKDIIHEISKAGGLQNWDNNISRAKKDWQKDIWQWLKEYPHTKNGMVPIYIGIGYQDSYYDAQKLLANYLPNDRVIEINGKHRFSTFKQIWDIFLDQGILLN